MYALGFLIKNQSLPLVMISMQSSKSNTGIFMTIAISAPLIKSYILSSAASSNAVSPVIGEWNGPFGNNQITLNIYRSDSISATQDSVFGY